MGFIYIETDFLTSEQRRFISEVLWEVGFENDIVIAPILFPHYAVKKGPLSASPLYKTIQKEGVPV